jgi:hypothetical protein
MTYHEEQHRELAALEARIHRALGQDQAIRRFNELAHQHAQLPHGPWTHWSADHRPLGAIARGPGPCLCECNRSGFCGGRGLWSPMTALRKTSGCVHIARNDSLDL